MIPQAHAVSAAAAGTVMLALSAAAATALEPGEWQQAERPAGFSVLSEPFLTDGTPGGQSNGAFLAIRCMGNRTRFEIMWGGKATEKSYPVNVAIDDLPPWQETWTPDEESGLLLGLRDDKAAIAFLNRVFPSKVMTLQFKTGRSISVFSFRMTKAEPHLRALAERCGWTLQ